MKNILPRISVITPSFNQGKFIKQTIDSVLNQNYPNLEYIIMDGGSTDETIEILKSYGSKIQWISKPDKGQSDALNKGLKQSTGDVVAYLNSDDVYLPNTLLRVGTYFSEHPNVLWLTGDYQIINESGKIIQSFVTWYKSILRTLSSPDLLCVVNFINQPSTFWRKPLLNELGYFDQSLHFCMDYDFWLRIIHKHPLHQVRFVFSAFRIHSKSKGGGQFIKQFEEEHTVAQRYTKNKILLFLHKLHANLISIVYTLIK